MSEEHAQPAGPDLAKGVSLTELEDGSPLLGHVGDDAVLLTRIEGELFAVGATCSHYGGPLDEGLVVDGTVRCPWHHACFSLRTGAMLRPPALNDVPRWSVAVEDGVARVTGPAPEAAGATSAGARTRPDSVLIVGGGAAGAVAAATLRREGYDGPVTIISADVDAPYDRPNCSKDYLAGGAPEEWMPLRPPGWYEARDITLVLGRRASAIDAAAHRVELAADGAPGGGDATAADSLEYGALLVATGAEPIRLRDAPEGRVRYMRSLADARALIEAAEGAGRAVVVGASFIGLEVAASLRTRGLEVHVVAPEAEPLERVLGPGMGAAVRRIHEGRGVKFHLGRSVLAVDDAGVVLDDGRRLDAPLIVAGIGVRPRVALLEAAGARTGDGVLVDAQLRTSLPDVWAAGDVARWPDPHTGEPVRVEHWVVAERQGATAARNMLGAGERFDAVPFFWSAHYDAATINYVGHAPVWDSVEIHGDPDAADAAAAYYREGRRVALATIYRDTDSLEAELAMERGAE